MSRALVGVLLFLVTLLCEVHPAAAQAPASSSSSPTADAKANAESLFLRGKELLDAGDCESAIPLLKESLRLDFGLGTLLWLSHCHEQTGRTASAWAGFKEAEQYAKREEQSEREKSARERAAALEPNLSRLRLVVAEENKGIGLVLRRNGVGVGEAAWGQLLPVDPGQQKLEASAPGYEPWTTTVDITAGPSEAEAIVPALERAPEVEAPSPTGSGIDARALRISGLAIGGAGVAGILIGAGFGIHAIVTYGEAVDTCIDGDPDLCTPTGVRLQQDASKSALVSTVAFSAGAAALAGGALMFFLAPSDDEPNPSVSAWVDGSGFFLSFGGAL